MEPARDTSATAVILSYRKNRQNSRLLFGTPRAIIRRGWHRKLALFYAGDVFAYERWCGDKYGTQHWRIAVCHAAVDGTFTRFPGVLPGAKLWLDVSGKTRAKRCLSAFDKLKESGKSLETCPEILWRELHHGLKTIRSDSDLDAFLSVKLPC